MLLDVNVPAFSFIFGIPPKGFSARQEGKRIITLGTVLVQSRAGFSTIVERRWLFRCMDFYIAGSAQDIHSDRFLITLESDIDN